ncbi:hypothetical protein IEQ34_018163 [Dendrobium chrysotoxum]|uniref:Uncharacterized protein n=1 Tax=Dendrobium chrysotoxum TaxID=161865 RepID=A0AAV7FW62_DENCH|nr:hypothetical protein IEQ34_018163 [Dendrobium chrysotoxum]
MRDEDDLLSYIISEVSDNVLGRDHLNINRPIRCFNITVGLCETSDGSTVAGSFILTLPGHSCGELFLCGHRIVRR